MTNPRQRSRPGLKPKFPRLKLLLAKRRINGWFTTADNEGLVHVHPAPQK